MKYLPCFMFQPLLGALEDTIRFWWILGLRLSGLPHPCYLGLGFPSSCDTYGKYRDCENPFWYVLKGARVQLKFAFKAMQKLCLRLREQPPSQREHTRHNLGSVDLREVCTEIIKRSVCRLRKFAPCG